MDQPLPPDMQAAANIATAIRNRTGATVRLWQTPRDWGASAVVVSGPRTISRVIVSGESALAAIRQLQAMTASWPDAALPVESEVHWRGAAQGVAIPLRVALTQHATEGQVITSARYCQRCRQPTPIVTDDEGLPRCYVCASYQGAARD